MTFKVVILLSCFSFLLSVSCTSDNISYNEYINKIINFEEIRASVKDSLGNTDEAVEIALRMFDASTKIPSGILAGNFYNLGNFDECYAIKYGDLFGKYCLGTLVINVQSLQGFKSLTYNRTRKRRTIGLHSQLRIPQMSTGNIQLKFAACVPSNWLAAQIPSLLKFSEDQCYSKATEPELSTGAIVTVVLLSFCLAIIVASTLFDIYLHYSKKETTQELFLAFSFLSNGRKIFRSTTNSDRLLCLNGIKAISIMWVIIGHNYKAVKDAPVSSLFYAAEFIQDAADMFIIGASVAVDTFFVVGGLLTVYVFLKSVDRGVKFNVILYYAHRYLRLTPALAIMALIHLYLLNYFGNGPLWKIVDLTLVKKCEEGWWSSFLYITNYVQHGICLPQTWYLSVDMQLFILSPIILIPLSKWPKIGLGALAFLAVAGCVVPFAVGYAENMGTAISTDFDTFFNGYYFQTYTRFGPYVIGMILGYFLYKITKAEMRIQLQPLVVLSLWLVCLIGLTACVYAGYPLYVATEEDRWGNSIFKAFNEPAWAVALSGIIFLCVAGYGGPVDGFLSLPIFQFLTKLSYSMYLVHPSVIVIRYSAMKNTFKFSHLAMMHSFWGDFMLTLVLSLILCLSFESPIIILEKYLFGRSQDKRIGKKTEA